MNTRTILGSHWWTSASGSVGVVAVEGGNDDWAAYIGVGSGTSVEGDEQHIAELGAKLHPEYAATFFRWLDVTKYRE